MVISCANDYVKSAEINSTCPDMTIDENLMKEGKDNETECEDFVVWSKEDLSNSETL